MSIDKRNFTSGYLVGSALRRGKQKPAKHVIDGCLIFSSPNPFTLGVYNATKNWDGILEWSTDDRVWTLWDGTTTLTAQETDGEYDLFVRGVGNTFITGGSYSSATQRWVLIGNSISCSGNIENILDYLTVANREQPVMGDYCFRHLFHQCTALTSPPTLPSLSLARYCYESMFYQCSNLLEAPVLPALIAPQGCYSHMFGQCSHLTYPPALPATTLGSYCYYYMFDRCSGLIQAPSLPATHVTPYCYAAMFTRCTSLLQIPCLPAISLAINCYEDMFYRCTSIKMSTTQAGQYTVAYRIPQGGDGVTETNALHRMFNNTGGTFTGTPTINTTYYTANEVV